MEKRAILINSIGKDEDIYGTRYDVENFYYFLKSLAGGEWINHEIEHSEDPSENYIRKISNYVFDYTLMMISCHGGIYVKDRRLYLELGGNDYVLDDLINNSPKQLIILDCCRSEFGEAKELLEKKSLRAAAISTRISYEEKIKEADDGIVVLLSCSENQSSILLNNSGSFFINSLLDIVKKYEIINNNIIDVKQALEESKKILRNEYPTIQVPEMLTSNSIFKYFPFAVL